MVWATGNCISGVGYRHGWAGCAPRHRLESSSGTVALHRPHLGITDGMSAVRVWACRYSASLIHSNMNGEMTEYVAMAVAHTTYTMIFGPHHLYNNMNGKMTEHIAMTVSPRHFFAAGRDAWLVTSRWTRRSDR